MALHSISIINKSGDTKVLWDPAVETDEGRAAVEEAERVFKDNTSGGKFSAFDMKDGVATRMEDFNPLVENIVLVPRIVGGA